MSPLDLPEEAGYDLAVPFIVCASNGGPYEDGAFVAGFQTGRVDAMLTAAAAISARRVAFMVNTMLLAQLELIGMYRGYPTMEVESYPDVPEWTHVTFVKGDL